MKCDELKVYEEMEDYVGYDNDTPTEMYDKSEADKVIADLEESHKKEVGQLLIEIAEQKSEIERLEILCADYRHDCDNLAISNEQVKRVASTLLKKMNHNKYKRCLAMARWCEEAYNRECGLNPEEMTNKEFYKQQTEFWYRWNSKWIKIAEQFKEAK